MNRDGAACKQADDAVCVWEQPGEYYNKEANIMNDVARFRKAAYTKDLLSSVGKKFLPAPSRHFLFTS